MGLVGPYKRRKDRSSFSPCCGRTLWEGSHLQIWKSAFTKNLTMLAAWSWTSVPKQQEDESLLLKLPCLWHLLQWPRLTQIPSVTQLLDVDCPRKLWLVKTIVFPVVMYGCESWTIKKLSTEELMLLNYGVGEDSWESLGLQGDPTSPS